MIVNEDDALARLHSSSNLMNRLRTASSVRRGAMGLFGVGTPASDRIEKTEKPERSITINNTNHDPASFNPFPSKTDTVSDTTALAKRDSVPPVNPPVLDDSESNSPNLDNLLDNADSRIKLTMAHNKALDTLVGAIDTMKLKIDEIKPEKLPAVISAAARVVNDIQRQRIDQNKSRTGREVHFHFYTPTQKKTTDYEIIDVG